MKRVIIVCLVMLLGLLTENQNVSAQVERVVVDSSFITCGNCYLCKVRIEDAANSVEGVVSSQWKATDEKLAIQYDNDVTSAYAVMQAVAAVGHDTELVQAPDDVYDALTGCCLYDRWIDYSFLNIDKNNFYELSIYPNPATEVLNVNLQNAANSVLKLYDLSGKKIKHVDSSRGNNTLNVSDVNSGTYLLVVESDGLVKACNTVIIK